MFQFVLNICGGNCGCGNADWSMLGMCDVADRGTPPAAADDVVATLEKIYAADSLGLGRLRENFLLMCGVTSAANDLKSISGLWKK